MRIIDHPANESVTESTDRLEANIIEDCNDTLPPPTRFLRNSNKSSKHNMCQVTTISSTGAGCLEPSTCHQGRIFAPQNNYSIMFKQIIDEESYTQDEWSRCFVIIGEPFMNE